MHELAREVNMAGLWNQSQAQILDQNGKPMAGAKAFFYAAATTTPLTVYGSYTLGTVNRLPNPVVADGYGRWPSVYLDENDEFFRVRVTSSKGVLVYDIDGIPIIGPPTEGGGGGAPVVPVDPTTLLSTGDTKWRYGTGFLSGFVQLNGRTIGSAVSGASERANSDVMGLYEFLWTADPNLVVVGGRGASAAADWGANKPLTLPDARGSALIGMDTMGNIAAGAIAAASVLGWKGGASTHTLTIAEMPAHDHDQAGDALAGAVGVSVGVSSGLKKTSMTGGGAAHNNVQPSLAGTWYMKI